MPVTSLFLLAFMAFANYRIVRFLILDSLIEESRMDMLHWLAARGTAHLWARKGYELATCPYCLSVWTGTGVFLATWAATPLPLPLLQLVALWGATMTIWAATE